jgi:hypothetical protein
MWVFGCKLVFPGFIGLVIGSTDDVLELVLGCVEDMGTLDERSRVVLT